MSEQGDTPGVDSGSRLKWIAGITAGVLGILLTLSLRVPGAPLLHWQPLLYLVFPLVILLALAAWHRRRPSENGIKGPADYGHVAGWALIIALLFYLFSGSADSTWFYFLQWFPDGLAESRYSFLSSGVVHLCLWTGVIAPVIFFCRSRTCMLVITIGVLAWCGIACFDQFWRTTGGEALYNGDHPCSMYRLWAYSYSFPGIIFYDPFWNGGREVSCLATTGIIPLGVIFLPLWKFSQMYQVYTPVLALVFMLVVPLVAGFSVRIARGGWIAACCAAILALGVSQDFFRWMLSNGAVGSCFTLALVMPVCACIYRVVWLDGLENRTGIILVLFSLMFLAWPPAAIIAAVFLPAVVLSAKQCSTRKVMLLVLCGFVVAVLWIPVVIGILAHADPGVVFGATSGKIDPSVVLREGWEQLCRLLRGGNPCIIFFGLLGLWFLPQKGMKLFYGSVVIGLCILAGWGDAWKPGLQLSRAGIPLFFASIIPAALWMEKWLEDSSFRMLMVRSAIIVLLLLSGLNSADIYANKGPASYATMSTDTRQLVEWIGRNTGENERILFVDGNPAAGYDMGNNACIPILTGREVVDANRFQLTLPEEAAKQAGNEADDIFSFMDLYNVSYVVTSREQWKDFFAQHREQYQEVKSFAGLERKNVFKVNRKPDQFIKGSGSVKASIDELVVRLDNPMEEAVLRYNWVEGMHAQLPAEIHPFLVDKDVRFIAVNPHGKSMFVIHCRRIF